MGNEHEWRIRNPLPLSMVPMCVIVANERSHRRLSPAALCDGQSSLHHAAQTPSQAPMHSGWLAAMSHAS